MENFTNIDYIVLCLVVGYGIVFGFRNTILRVASWLCLGTYTQSAQGQILDGTFYAGTLYLF